MVGTGHVLPPGSVVPRPGRIEVRIGAPLEFPASTFVRAPRQGPPPDADQTMAAIQALTGQETVATFASDRKAELAAAAPPGAAPTSSPAAASANLLPRR